MAIFDDDDDGDEDAAIQEVLLRLLTQNSLSDDGEEAITLGIGFLAYPSGDGSDTSLDFISFSGY